MLCSIDCYYTSEECGLKDVNDNGDPAMNIKERIDIIDVVALMYQKDIQFPDAVILAEPVNCLLCCNFLPKIWNWSASRCHLLILLMGLLYYIWLIDETQLSITHIAIAFWRIIKWTSFRFHCFRVKVMDCILECYRECPDYTVVVDLEMWKH
jgi:hypothetical protein